MSLSGGCECRPISLKQNLKIEANVVVFVCPACYSESFIKVYILFPGEGCFTTPLVIRRCCRLSPD